MPEEFKRCVHCREQIELINFSLEITDSVVEISKIRMFTSEEVIQIANETSDNQGNLYRIDFINRIKQIKLPNVYTRESVEKVIGETVLATLNLAVEGPRRPKFHPVLGLASDEKSDTP